MGFILPILLAFDGYLTIAGLGVAAVGQVAEFFAPEVGQPIKETGWIISGVGGVRKGVKKKLGKPAF